MKRYQSLQKKIKIKNPENTKKRWKKMNKTVKELKIEVETIKTPNHLEGILNEKFKRNSKWKKSGIQTETEEAYFTSRMEKKNLRH